MADKKKNLVPLIWGWVVSVSSFLTLNTTHAWAGHSEICRQLFAGHVVDPRTMKKFFFTFFSLKVYRVGNLQMELTEMNSIEVCPLVSNKRWL